MDTSTTRKHTRLPFFDYSSGGYYFITICSRDKREVFGNIKCSQVFLSMAGSIAERNLLALPMHVRFIGVDRFIVMPNHVHLILIVEYDTGFPYTTFETQYISHAQKRSKAVVPKAIQQYKASVTRDYGTSGLWQSGYYDRIIRNEKEYIATCKYMEENPLRWDEDEYFP